jgi:DNA-binding transcriptional ArsR family regulator
MGIVMKEGIFVPRNAAGKIMDFVGRHSTLEITAYNISKELKMPLSTAQRGIKTLAKSGIVSVVKEQKERESLRVDGTKLKYRGLKRKYYDFTFYGALIWLFRSTNQITIEKFAENIDLYISILERGIETSGAKIFRPMVDTAKRLDTKEKGMPSYRIALILTLFDSPISTIKELDMFQGNEDSLLTILADIFLDSAIKSAHIRKEKKDIRDCTNQEKKILIKGSFFPVFFESGFIEREKQHYKSMLTEIEEVEKNYKKWKEEHEESKS